MGKPIRAVAIAVMVLLAWPAGALTIDLTSAGADGSINGAYFVQIDPQSTGTGVIDSFEEIFGAGVIEAYNTTADDVLGNGSTDQFNHALLLANVTVVSIGGGLYLEFLLDVDQTGANPDISLDEIQVFRSSTPNQSVETFDAQGILQLADSSLVYRLDSGGTDNWVWLDYSLNSGSGSGDMFMYVPAGLFAAGSGDYVYLYSRFGENYAANDGFEEWAVQTGEQVIPEPASFVLMLMGVAGIYGFKRKRTL